MTRGLMANYRRYEYPEGSSRLYLRSDFDSNGSALLLDRDGVLNADSGYVGKREQVTILPGIASEIYECNRSGTACFVVTNQSGIGRGYFNWDDFEEVMSTITEAISLSGAWIDGVIACSALPSEKMCSWRKPAPTMITKLREMGGFDTSRCWLVGDRETDIAAAAGAEIRGGILVSNDALSDLSWAERYHDLQIEIAPTASDAIRIANGKLHR